MAHGIEEQTLDQADVLANLFPKDSMEYKLLLRYAEKKQTITSHPPQSNSVGETSPTPSQDHHKKRKRKKRRIWKIFRCFRPEQDDDHAAIGRNRQRASMDSPGPNQVKVEQVVNKLTKIADCVQFQCTEIESDSDDLVEKIVELLREHGDKLNEEFEKNQTLKKKLQDSLSYNFFNKLTRVFMLRLSPEDLPKSEDPQQAKIAITCELTSRLNAMDCHPMNRVLGFGAKYLQDYFTPWVNQQGGYEKVFGEDSDSEEEVQ